MNGHGLGERASWVLAAALVAVGSGSLTGDRPADAALTRSAAVGAATTDGSTNPAPAKTAAELASANRATLPEPYLGPAVGTFRPGSAELALADDAYAWPTVKPTTTVAPKPAVATSTVVWWKQYHGTNHVWMPTLAINKPVYLFPCSRSRDPDNYVYRWGCAGTNNVYLLGHAYGVFKALHDAYYNGKLKVGMPVVYADGNGRVHLFRVTTWRVVSPMDVQWAYEAQPRLSMTLQTCIGKYSQYRLNVRLVAVDH